MEYRDSGMESPLTSAHGTFDACGRLLKRMVLPQGIRGLLPVAVNWFFSEPSLFLFFFSYILVLQRTLPFLFFFNWFSKNHHNFKRYSTCVPSEMHIPTVLYRETAYGTLKIMDLRT